MTTITMEIYKNTCLLYQNRSCMYQNGYKFVFQFLRVMVLNTTFKNISVISWRSVLLVEETRVSRESHRPATSHWQTLSHNVVSSTPRHERDSNFMFLTIYHKSLVKSGPFMCSMMFPSLSSSNTIYCSLIQ